MARRFIFALTVPVFCWEMDTLALKLLTLYFKLLDCSVTSVLKLIEQLAFQDQSWTPLSDSVRNHICKSIFVAIQIQIVWCKCMIQACSSRDANMMHMLPLHVYLHTKLNKLTLVTKCLLIDWFHSRIWFKLLMIISIPVVMSCKLQKWLILLVNFTADQ